MFFTTLLTTNPQAVLVDSALDHLHGNELVIFQNYMASKFLQVYTINRRKLQIVKHSTFIYLQNLNIYT